MGRKNTKTPGALVKLYRRKKSGLGIILEVTDTDAIRQFARDKFKIRFKDYNRIRERIGYNKLYEYKHQGKITEDQVRMLQCYFMYANENSCRRVAKVQWIQKPSAWEMKTATEKADWYPLDMIRTVSAVKSS